MGQDIAICDDIPVMCCAPLQPLPHKVQAVHEPPLHPVHPLQATEQDFGIAVAPRDMGHMVHIEHIFAGAFIAALTLYGPAKRARATIMGMSFMTLGFANAASPSREGD